VQALYHGKMRQKVKKTLSLNELNEKYPQIWAAGI